MLNKYLLVIASRLVKGNRSVFASVIVCPNHLTEATDQFVEDAQFGRVAMLEDQRRMVGIRSLLLAVLLWCHFHEG